MPTTHQTAFRLPLELLERIDDYAEKLAQNQPGIAFTRAGVVRLLLNRALDTADADPTPAGAPPPKKDKRR